MAVEDKALFLFLHWGGENVIGTDGSMSYIGGVTDHDFVKPGIKYKEFVNVVLTRLKLDASGKAFHYTVKFDRKQLIQLKDQQAVDSLIQFNDDFAHVYVSNSEEPVAATAPIPNDARSSTTASDEVPLKCSNDRSKSRDPSTPSSANSSRNDGFPVNRTNCEVLLPRASETIAYDDKLVGAKVKIWWPVDRMYYEGVIESFDPVTRKHKVFYTDGDKETLDLIKELWQFVEDPVSLEEQEAEQGKPNAASRMQTRKKAKTTTGSLVKHGKTELSSPKSGSTSFSKSKGTARRSGRKSKVDGKVDPKSKDRTARSGV